MFIISVTIWWPVGNMLLAVAPYQASHLYMNLHQLCFYFTLIMSYYRGSRFLDWLIKHMMVAKLQTLRLLNYKKIAVLLKKQQKKIVVLLVAVCNGAARFMSRPF